MTTGAMADAGGIISTGSSEIDKKLGGGIPVGSLVLLEGQSDSGKSVVSQHFTHGSLNTRMSAAYYTTENTVKSLMTQMASLNLDVTDYFLCDRLRVYPLEMSSTKENDTKEAFRVLLDHFDSLPVRFKLTIVDSLTGLVSHSDDRAIIDFFASCKQLCDRGRTIIAVVHSYAFDDRMLIRIRSLCDAHLVLKVDQVGERLIKIMEVAKVRNADQSTGNIISFDVEPGMGMKIIPISKAKA
ncbi:MAG: flagellar accessory protein FlaH [Chloroflexi bacterium]|nr:flagellar accessory protein FlaH [Chloroflexota bacterium]MCH8224262.1 flagellar accessory protein FlaH [Chloroflexota bacterium]MCI0845600.1 flagellar accessory protein FlaH [Chloroflexota bacterium]